MIAQTERDAKDIQAGRMVLSADNRPIVPPEQGANLGLRSDSALRQVAANVHRNQLAQYIRREVNVSKALLEAEAELGNDPQPPPERRVDDDWLFRWRDAASMVSSEELQTLWGRVLAGEIKSPGSCSLRTLEFLKNLSRYEALQIAKVSRFVINNDAIFPGNESVLESEGITFMFLQHLQDLGIVAGHEARGLGYEAESSRADKFQHYLISHDRLLLVTHEDASKVLRFKIYLLTAIGKEIFKLGSFEAHEAYLRSLGEYIRGEGFTVRIARWEKLTETEGRIHDVQELGD